MIEIHLRHGQAKREAPYDLTEQGRTEALAAARYIRENFARDFQIGYTSPSARARQTAELLGYEDSDWNIDPRLRELSWGKLPPANQEQVMRSPEYRKLSWRANPDGESWEEVLERLRSLYGEIDSRHGRQNRLVVSHGGTLRMSRMYRENIPAEDFGKLFEGPYKFFTNCQLIIYADEDPRTGKVEPGRRWVKSVCPWDPGRFGHDWRNIQ